MKQKILAVGLSLGISAVLVAGCASTLNSNAKITDSIEQNRKNQTDTELVYMQHFKVASHTTNYDKPLTTLNPDQLDDKYENFWGVLDPDVLLSSPKYLALIQNLTAKEIQADLWDELIDIVNNNSNIYIDFSPEMDHIIPPFELVRDQENKLQIKNFKLQFKITNDNFNSFLLFKAINLEPKSTTTVNISALLVGVQPSYFMGNDNAGILNNTYAAYQLVPISEASIEPKNNTDSTPSFNVQTAQWNQSQQLVNHQTFTTENLSLFTTYSRALNHSYNRFRMNPSFQKIEQEAKLKLRDLTNDDIKKDVNDYFITYLRYYILRSFNDVQTVTKYLLQTKQLNSNGVLVPIIEILATDKTKRDEIFAKFYLPDPLKKFLQQLLNPRTGYQPPTLEHILAFAHWLADNDFVNFLTEGLQIEIQWNKQPVVEQNETNNPLISFDFNITVAFLKDFQFKFENTVFVPELNKNVTYDLNKYLNVNTIVSLFGLDLSEGMGKSIIDSFKNVLSFSNFNLKKGESFDFGFKADKSPFQFKLFKSLDKQKAKQFTFGWSATDASLSINLAKVPTFWANIYESLNKIAYDGKASLATLGSKFADGDFTALIQLLNYLYVPKQYYGQWQEPITARGNRPVEVLLNSFLNKTYNLKSFPFDVGMSRAFYHLQDKVDDQPFWTTKIKSVDNQEVEIGISNNQLKLSEFQVNPPSNQPNHLNSDLLVSDSYFSLKWKDPLMNEYADNYVNHHFTNDSVVYDAKQAKPLIDQLVADAAKDKLLEFKNSKDADLNGDSVQKFLQNIASKVAENTYSDLNLKKPIYHDGFQPKVSLVKLDIHEALTQLVKMKVQASFGYWVDMFLPGIISQLPSILVMKNAYVLVINTQITNNLFYIHPNNPKFQLSSNGSNLIYQLIAPRFNIEGVKDLVNMVKGFL